MLALALAAPATAANHRIPERLAVTRHAVVFYRAATWHRQDERLVHRTSTNYAERRSHSRQYLASVAIRWRARARRERALAKKYENPLAAIRYVFGRYAEQAIAVARCEGGSPVPSVNAQNGQYLGIFQMGSGERSRYGHSRTALGQATAAYRYFIAGGKDWHQWQCRPGGLAW